MSKATIQQKISQFVRSAFQGVYDDEWTDVEDNTIGELMERFGLTEDQAEQAVNEYIG